MPGLGGDTITVTVRNNLDRNATLEITESQKQVLHGARTIAAPSSYRQASTRCGWYHPRRSGRLQLRGVEGYFDSTRISTTGRGRDGSA